jgi:hypothetical protein
MTPHRIGRRSYHPSVGSDRTRSDGGTTGVGATAPAPARAAAAAPEPDEIQPGDCIGRHAVRGLLGAGGMGRWPACDHDVGVAGLTLRHVARRAPARLARAAAPFVAAGRGLAAART